MKWNHRPAVAACLLAALAPGAFAQYARIHSSVQRMLNEHLEKAHTDVANIKAARKDVSAVVPGLHDYRAILHAHAEDSAHTGGTRPEMLADAKVAGVDVIMLTDHFRPPRDFMDSWRGMRDGVLFIPGSESHGFLVYPDGSVMAEMQATGDGAKEALIKTVGAGTGMLFLSHVEERVNHSMDGLLGMEVYNRHADAKDDVPSMITLANWALDPKESARLLDMLKIYPAELLASQLDYPKLYMDKWDKESQARRIVGVAANDCHHNQVFIVKMVDDETVILGTIVDKDEDMRPYKVSQKPAIKELMTGHKPGDTLVSLDLDPYRYSFLNESTHILAPELTEPAIRAALHEGNAYVSHDWMCDPKGFQFYAAKDKSPKERPAIMGDEVAYTAGLALFAEFPVSCKFRLIRNGAEVHSGEGADMEFTTKEPGTYRVEGGLTVDGEDRVWIYSNPIYVR